MPATDEPLGSFVDPLSPQGVIRESGIERPRGTTPAEFLPARSGRAAEPAARVEVANRPARP